MKTSTRIALMIWPFVFGGLIAVGVTKCERAWFPVVKDFTVNEVVQEKQRIVFSGTMNKVRACEFLGVTASGGDHFALGVSFDDDITRKTSTRPQGFQEWGPWHVDVSPEDTVPYIRLVALHNCFPFGMTHTPLAKINLE